MRDVLRYAEDVAVIPIDQLTEGLQIPAFSGVDQRHLVSNTFCSLLLDGWHATPTQIIYYVMQSERTNSKEKRAPNRVTQTEA
jgi:hypothetical protein